MNLPVRAVHAAALVTALIASSAVVAWSDDPVAVLTELRHGSGRVEVMARGAGVWRLAQPLLALRPGDLVRATADGRAAVVFAGARSARVITAASSPLTVEAPTGEALPARARAVVGDVLRTLTLTRERQIRSLSTRGMQDFVLLAPRQTRVFADRVSLEWQGPAGARYSVRVLAPGGVVWERPDVERSPVVYPPEAPPLQPSVRYEWEVRAPGRVPEHVEFEVVPAADGARVREALSSLAGAKYPPATLALLRAGVLFDARLYADARAELLAALEAAPDEPSLHFLLAHVYDATGLGAQAEVELQKANR